VKKNIIQALFLTYPNLQKPFEVHKNESVYSMGEVFMQGERPVFYHSEILHGEVINYPTYEKELYALVQDFNKWKHYIMGNETIINTNHQPLQYL
jgi:hypothetical protein